MFEPAGEAQSFLILLNLNVLLSRKVKSFPPYVAVQYAVKTMVLHITVETGPHKVQVCENGKQTVQQHNTDTTRCRELHTWITRSVTLNS